MSITNFMLRNCTCYITDYGVVHNQLVHIHHVSQCSYNYDLTACVGNAVGYRSLSTSCIQPWASHKSVTCFSYPSTIGTINLQSIAFK